MVLASPAEVLQILTEGRDGELIGVEESRWLDVKSQPYLFDKDRSRWELAKDVSAMANAEGGVILIAAKTDKPATYLEERIIEVVAVPAEKIDPKQYLDTIAQWTFPSIAHRVRTHVFPRSGAKVLLALEVQPLASDEQPVMVATTVTMDGKEVPAWAIARRMGSGTEWITAAQVWADIRDGRLARRNLTLPRTWQPGWSDEDRVEAKVDQLSELAAVEGQAVLAYTALPPPGLRLASFYADDGILGALRRLPQRGVRESGFGLGYGLDVHSVGAGLADIEEGRRAVMVEPDGTMTAIAVANREFLGWADRGAIPPASLANRPAVRLNPYVLAEFSLEFARFVGQLMETTTRSGWRLGIVGRCLKTGDPVPYLPTNVNSMSFAARTAVIDNGLIVIPAESDPARNAYELLRCFVEWFGVPADQILFAANHRITEETVRSWNR